MAEGSAESGDLFYQTAAQEEVGFAGHEIDGIDLGGERVVVDGHGKLEFEVGDDAQAPDEGDSPFLLGEVYREIFEMVHGDSRSLGEHFTEHFHPLFGGEESDLGVVDGDGDDNVVEDLHGAQDEV